MREPYFENPSDVIGNKKAANLIIGKRIKELRKSKNNTQKELAQYLELGKNKSENSGKQIISNAERGVRCLPANILPLIADKYETNVESFFNKDRTYAMSLNTLYQLLSKIEPDDDKRNYAMKYMDYLSDCAAEKITAERLFDIIYIVMRSLSFGNTDGKYIGEQIDIINRAHQNNNKSMCIESAVTISKELVDRLKKEMKNK